MILQEQVIFCNSYLCANYKFPPWENQIFSQICSDILSALSNLTIPFTHSCTSAHTNEFILFAFFSSIHTLPLYCQFFFYQSIAMYIIPSSHCVPSSSSNMSFVVKTCRISINITALHTYIPKWVIFKHIICCATVVSLYNIIMCQPISTFKA